MMVFDAPNNTIQSWKKGPTGWVSCGKKTDNQVTCSNDAGPPATKPHDEFFGATHLAGDNLIWFYSPCATDADGNPGDWVGTMDGLDHENNADWSRDPINGPDMVTATGVERVGVVAPVPIPGLAVQRVGKVNDRSSEFDGNIGVGGKANSGIWGAEERIQLWNFDNGIQPPVGVIAMDGSYGSLLLSGGDNLSAFNIGGAKLILDGNTATKYLSAAAVAGVPNGSAAIATGQPAANTPVGGDFIVQTDSSGPGAECWGLTWDYIMRLHVTNLTAATVYPIGGNYGFFIVNLIGGVNEVFAVDDAGNGSQLTSHPLWAYAPMAQVSESVNWKLKAGINPDMKFSISLLDRTGTVEYGDFTMSVKLDSGLYIIIDAGGKKLAEGSVEPILFGKSPGWEEGMDKEAAWDAVQDFHAEKHLDAVAEFNHLKKLGKKGYTTTEVEVKDGKATVKEKTVRFSEEDIMEGLGLKEVPQKWTRKPFPRGMTKKTINFSDFK